MAQVLQQRRWRSAASLLAVVAWVLGTNFCALGLMVRPCAVVAGNVAPAASICPHCPAQPPSVPAPTTTPCCQEVRAELPPTAVTVLPPLPLVALATDWVDTLSRLALMVAPEDSSARVVVPDTGPPMAAGSVMRVLLGRCAPVHAPPVSA